MSLKTFSYKMNMGVSSDVIHAVSRIQFGDGYSQHISHGINNRRQNWNGEKVCDYQTVIKPIVDFLNEHKGVTLFCGPIL